jgi:hypothetical protein
VRPGSDREDLVDLHRALPKAVAPAAVAEVASWRLFVAVIGPDRSAARVRG